VVLESHRQWWTPELRHLPQENVAVQPANRGTGAAVLLPLLSILDQDPEATVVVFPCDHFVEQEAVLRRALRDTLAVAGDRLVLLGAKPRSNDTELGWICPQHAAVPEPAPISTFVEKPAPEVLERLRRKGALVNTLILTGPAAALLELYRESAPDVLELLGGDRGDPKRPTPEALEHAYREMEHLDFSRDLLEPAAQHNHLWVTLLPSCGWSDLGTKERLESVRWQLTHQVAVATPHPDPELCRFGPDYWLG
jgi:mannose-1-phosphate guanylyltransferase